MDVNCLHLLIKHEGSRNPVSRRTNASTAKVSKADAIAELKQWEARIRKGEISFEDAAKQRSDCGSFAQGGSLGTFGKGEMQKPFEDAAFALKVRRGQDIFVRLLTNSEQVGEISGIVDTDSGVHIIKRLA
jgi:peptidylprolyl isomerase